MSGHTSFSYVKKITASAGFLRSLAEVLDTDGKTVLRPAADAVPVMRVKGIVDEGFEETSEFGEFVRWVGSFQAYAFQRDGSLAAFQSRNGIFPAIASELIMEAFKSDKKETSAKGRTGVHYAPKGGEGTSVEVVFDLWIAPPKKENARGYEFVVKPILAPDAVNPLDKIGSDAPVFGAAQIEGPHVHKALPSPSPEPTEKKPEHAPKK